MRDSLVWVVCDGAGVGKEIAGGLGIFEIRTLWTLRRLRAAGRSENAPST